MKAIANGSVLLIIAVAAGPLPVTALSAEGEPDAVPKWEYRVVTKEAVLELGKKDLAAGLNRLGDEGWELVALDAAYIFKRPEGHSGRRVEDLKGQITLIEADVETLKDRVAWSQRMAKKGFLSDQRVQAERAALKRAEFALDKARRLLKGLPADPKEPSEKERGPQK